MFYCRSCHSNIISISPRNRVILYIYCSKKKVLCRVKSESWLVFNKRVKNTYELYVLRNRLPMISDGLSHWSDIFHWRHHHYEAIVSAYDAQHDQVDTFFDLFSYLEKVN